MSKSKGNGNAGGGTKGRVTIPPPTPPKNHGRTDKFGRISTPPPPNPSKGKK